MTETPRDLQADLAICEAATPGPWRVYRSQYFDCEWECGHKADDPPCEKGVGECEYIKQREPADVGGPFEVDCGEYRGLSNENAEFIAAAREGWPHAIKRALAAERRVRQLESAVRDALAWLQQYQERYHLVDEPPIARQLREVLGEEVRS